MYYTEKELIARQKQSIYKIKGLIKKNLLELEDISALLPGYMHLNRKNDFGLTFLNDKGRQMIGYSMDELNDLGFEVLEKHQSKQYLEGKLPKIANHFNTTESIQPISFIQDWKMNHKKDKFSFFASSRMEYDELQYITFTQGLETLEKLASPFLESFQDFKIYKEYFNVYLQLTDRERQLLELLATGESRKTIASKLFIATATVKKHCENIYRKLGTSDRIVIFKIIRAFS